MRTRSPLAANAALQDVAHAEIASDLAHVGRLALVLEGGIAGDDEQLGEPRQLGDDIVGNAVAEIVLVLVAAQVVERQHGDRRPVGQGQGGGGLLGRGDRRGDPGRLPFLAHHAHEAHALAGQGLDQALSLAAVADGAPRPVDAAGKRRFRDDAPVPDLSDQVVPADDALAVLDHERQQVEDLGLDRRPASSPRRSSRRSVSSA